MTPLSAEEIARLRGLLEVANDPTIPAHQLPPSWWASFGRECAETIPRLLAAQTDFIEAADAMRRHIAPADDGATDAALAYDRERKNVAP